MVNGGWSSIFVKSKHVVISIGCCVHIKNNGHTCRLRFIFYCCFFCWCEYLYGINSCSVSKGRGDDEAKLWDNRRACVIFCREPFEFSLHLTDKTPPNGRNVIIGAFMVVRFLLMDFICPTQQCCQVLFTGR